MVGKSNVNPLHAIVYQTLAIQQMLYLLGSLLLQVQKEPKLQILTAVKFSEKTNIFPKLTPLLPKIRLIDGQIPPDFLTYPSLDKLKKGTESHIGHAKKMFPTDNIKIIFMESHLGK